MSVTRLTGTFGAQINGLDLSGDVGRYRDDLEDLVGQHKLLVFRDQHAVDPRALVRLASLFGEPETAPHPTHRDIDGVAAVKVLTSNGTGTEDTWHTDGSTRENTSWLTVLQAISIPECGRDTLFADAEAIYDRLSVPFRTMLEGLTAQHSWGIQKPDAPPIDHPLVTTNPRTGRKRVYVSRVYTRSILELTGPESRAMLEFLFAQATIPEVQCRVRWEPGTIVMWDNEATVHYLVQDFDFPRVLHRIMVDFSSRVHTATQQLASTSV